MIKSPRDRCQTNDAQPLNTCTPFIRSRGLLKYNGVAATTASCYGCVVVSL
jgi:hypothetical protein